MSQSNSEDEQASSQPSLIVPNTDVSNKPQTNQSIDLNNVLILQPGSAYLRVSRATDTTLELIPHTICYRNKKASSELINETLLFHEEEQRVMEYNEARKLYLGEICSFLKEVRLTGSVPLHPKRLREKNDKIQPNTLSELSEISYTVCSPSKPIYIGEDALHMPPSESYAIHWPIRRGRFNIKGCVTREVVLQCLEDIWSEAISNLLKVDRSNFGEYKILLLIPDLFDRSEVKDMVDVLLKRLNFGSVTIQQESVCAVYGAGLSSACVVDVGDQKIAVSCIDDGISNHHTRLVLKYGGNDVTRAFCWLINQAGFPYKEWTIENNIDRCLIEELKEDVCNLNLDQSGIREYTFKVHPPGRNAILYPMFLCDEPILAPLTYFCPAFLNIPFQQHVVTMGLQTAHSEDALDDINLLENKPQITGGALSERSLENSSENETQLPLISKHIQNKLDKPNSKITALDEAIHCSISFCNEQIKQKMYENILITGGGFLFPKSIQFLQNRLRDTLPTSVKKVTVEIQCPSHTTDLSHLSWRGACVVATLDSLQEMWIGQAEWRKIGVRLIRERAPFLW